jgi:hypothetical protein
MQLLVEGGEIIEAFSRRIEGPGQRIRIQRTRHSVKSPSHVLFDLLLVNPTLGSNVKIVGLLPKQHTVGRSFHALLLPVVRHFVGQALAHVIAEEEPGRRSAAKLLTKDEARRLAVNFAKLPTLLRKRL